MPTLPPRYNFGSEIKNVNPVLYNQLSDSYSDTARVVNTKPNKNPTTIDPSADSAANASYGIGDFWVNSSTNKAWILTSRTTNNAVTWTLIT